MWVDLWIYLDGMNCFAHVFYSNSLVAKLIF